MIFSGRRWRVLVVDDKDKVIEVSPDPGGTPPQFGGEGADIHDRVAETMQRIYASNDVPIYLNEAAATLLDEARKGYRRLGLEDSRVIERGEDRCLIFGWQGSIATTSLAMALCARGISSHPRHIVIETQCSQDDLREALGEIARAPQPNPLDLAEQLIGLEREKFHPYLDQQLLLLDAAHSRIAASRVPEFTQTLLQ